jgi:hypothetical protein
VEVARKRVWKRLLASPWVVVPLAVGIVATASLVISGSGAVVAATCFAVCSGVIAYRLAFGFDKITELAANDSTAAQKELEVAQLDKLQDQLRVDRDFRTKDILAATRQLRSEFQELASSPEMKQRANEIGKQLDHLFWTAIKQLEYSLKLFHQADRLVDGQRIHVLQERESVILELQSSVDRMRQATTHFRQWSNSEQGLDLKPLQDELDASMRVAKRTEERMRELELEHNHNEFLKD